MSEPEDRFERLNREAEAAGLDDRKYDKLGLPISLGEWCRRMEDRDYRRVALTRFGSLIVSTVWLGLDHNFARFHDGNVDRRPILFETMIFWETGDALYPWSSSEEDHELAGNQWRWHTFEDAVAGHDQVVEKVKASIVPELEEFIRQEDAQAWLRSIITEVYRD